MEFPENRLTWQTLSLVSSRYVAAADSTRLLLLLDRVGAVVDLVLPLSLPPSLLLDQAHPLVS